MTQLKTTFAGLSLRNPIIISSSSLTNSAEKNKKLELAGAGADCFEISFRRADHDGSTSHGYLWFSRRR